MISTAENRMPKIASPRFEWWLCWLIIAMSFAATVYKAAVTSFGYDEALYWELYIRHGFRETFAVYYANNNVINTLLTVACEKLLGPGEFSLRLPALLGRALFLSSLPFLACQFVRTPLIRVGMVAIIATQPILMDWGAASRGYSLSLGFALWAVWLGKRSFDDILDGGIAGRAAMGRLIVLSTVMGLSVATVPTDIHLMLPVVALVIGAVAARPGVFVTGKAGGRTRALLLGTALLGIPAAIINFGFYGPLLSKVSRGALYAGKDTLWECLQFHFLTMAWYSEINFGMLPDSVITPLKEALLLPSIQAVIIGLGLGVPMLIAIRFRSRSLVFPLALIVGAFVIFTVEHLLVGFPFPLVRTSLYLNPLVFLSIFVAADVLWARHPRALTGWALGLVYTIWFAVQSTNWNYEFHFTFRLSPPVRWSIEYLERKHLESGETISLAYSDLIRPEFPYYKDSRRLDWLELSLLSETLKDGRDVDYYFYFEMDGPRPDDVNLISAFPNQRAYLFERKSK